MYYKRQWKCTVMINSNAEASNTFQMLSCMLCNGASNDEPLISIYRVFWAHIAVVRWSMLLCHVSWAPQTFTWKSGWIFWPSKCCCVFHDEHQNVVVFFIRMLMFIMTFIWVHHLWMNDKFLGLSNVCLMNLWALLMSCDFCTNIRNLLG